MAEIHTAHTADLDASTLRAARILLDDPVGAEDLETGRRLAEQVAPDRQVGVYSLASSAFGEM